ncbi:hypothetical protein L2E82_18514 [Cichorium intybus]|uniref:Uncharacterized protein n=1 Tax=Cichorium intybus TaxID=13427 RepID=A0ACB9FAK5_CICIN|nr:hypothetical protein L2E82_18514 [Cichorium intybus]
MPGDNPNPTSLPNKIFGITNIKTYIPIVLDLERFNYDAWRALFNTHCKAFDVIDHIDDSRPKSTDPEWEKIDSMIQLWLYGCLSQNVLHMVLKDGQSAREIWLRLENLFRSNKESRAMRLDAELRTITMGDMSASDYFSKIKTLADQLENLGSKVPDKNLVMYAVNEPIPAAASHRDHASSPTVLHASGNPPSAVAGNSDGNRQQGRRSDRRQSNQRRRQPNQQPRYGWVYFAPPDGQFQQQQRPPGPASNSFSNWAPSSAGLLGPAPLQQSTQRMFSPNVPAQAHLAATVPSPTPSAHLAATQTQPAQAWQNFGDQATTLPQFFNTFSLNDPGNDGWIMDTGATDHVHGNGGILKSVSNIHGPRFIYVGNGSKMPISMTGHTIFPISNPFRPLYLNNVLITPNIIKNLISVRSFSRQNKCSIEFDEFGFTVNDYRSKQPLIRCDSDGPLYDVTPSPQVFVASSVSLWHQRLGHPGDQVLKSLVSNKFIACNKDANSISCHACKLGKFVRLPFLNSNSVVANAFDIIHSDIWTSPITSISDHYKSSSM